ncbi:hypothetical protein KP509_28G056600 [Ceratopteris richardii]|uniref:Uncharacterized protein n=1 Tax=Ceratopteris richardii TaxID=49495 RepID=A0A8T2RE18_CERRI|nr:hypothetical protein KP509_28G056600 [Ceratopteris richardii]
MMALKIPAADFATRSASEDLKPCTMNVFPCSGSLHSSNRFLSYSYFVYPAVWFKKPGHFTTFRVSCKRLFADSAQVSLTEDSRNLFNRNEKAKGLAGTKIKGIINWRAQQCLRVQSKPDDESYRNLCNHGSIHVCRTFPGILPGEEEEKQVQRYRNLGLLRILAQFVLDSTIARSPLLRLLWIATNELQTDSLEEDECSTEGNAVKHHEKGLQSPVSGSLHCFLVWKDILVGFVFGTLITAILTRTVAIGTLVDGFFWLALLVSVMFPIARMIQSGYLKVMSFGKRKTATNGSKSFSVASHGNFHPKFFKQMIPHAGLTFQRLLSPNTRLDSKPRSVAPSGSGVKSGSCHKYENRGLGSVTNKALTQVYSKLHGILYS